MKLVKKFESLSRRQQQIWIYGTLFGVAIFILILVILNSIKIVPYSVYENKAAGVRIKYPSYWTAIDQPEGGTVVAFMSPQQNPLDMFSENVNITIQPLPPKAATLDRFSALIIKQVTGTFGENVKVLKSEPVSLGKHRGHLFQYMGQGKLEGKEVENPMEYMHAWFITDTYAYIFTYAGQSSEFDKFSAEIKGMLKSFELIPPS